MKKRIFRIGDEIKSDSVYSFDSSQCDIYIKDTICVSERKYLSLVIGREIK